MDGTPKEISRNVPRFPRAAKEFPHYEFEEDVEMPEGFEDCSWINDAGPSFHTPDLTQRIDFLVPEGVDHLIEGKYLVTFNRNGQDLYNFENENDCEVYNSWFEVELHVAMNIQFLKDSKALGR
tara:strand:- start:555 stop:926 length:372 start_codon:yes stop_codon:yes gene_type:complete